MDMDPSSHDERPAERPEWWSPEEHEIASFCTTPPPNKPAAPRKPAPQPSAAVHGAQHHASTNCSSSRDSRNGARGAGSTTSPPPSCLKATDEVDEEDDDNNETEDEAEESDDDDYKPRGCKTFAASSEPSSRTTRVRRATDWYGAQGEPSVAEQPLASSNEDAPTSKRGPGRPRKDKESPSSSSSSSSAPPRERPPAEPVSDSSSSARRPPKRSLERNGAGSGGVGGTGSEHGEDGAPYKSRKYDCAPASKANAASSPPKRSSRTSVVPTRFGARGEPSAADQTRASSNEDAPAVMETRGRPRKDQGSPSYSPCSSSAPPREGPLAEPIPSSSSARRPPKRSLEPNAAPSDDASSERVQSPNGAGSGGVGGAGARVVAPDPEGAAEAPKKKRLENMSEEEMDEEMKRLEKMEEIQNMRLKLQENSKRLGDQWG